MEYTKPLAQMCICKAYGGFRSDCYFSTELEKIYMAEWQARVILEEVEGL